METIAQMSKAEFRQMLEEVVEAAVEQKLSELLRDPDEGMLLREELHKQLADQRQAVSKGERGHSLEEILNQLGVNVIKLSGLPIA
jgi:hypothetical protein